MSDVFDLQGLNDVEVKNLRIGAARLSKLADYLAKQVPSDSFDMDYWVNGDNVEVKTNSETIAVKKLVKDVREGTCGTTACAFGHAASMPEFRAAGLSWELDIRLTDGEATVYDSDIIYKIPGKNWTYENFEAAREFFHLGSDDNANHLFNPSDYDHRAPRNVVVARLRKCAKQMIEFANAKSEIIAIRKKYKIPADLDISM